MCKNFREKGVCKYGDKCLFAHGEHELSRRETTVSVTAPTPIVVTAPEVIESIYVKEEMDVSTQAVADVIVKSDNEQD